MSDVIGFVLYKKLMYRNATYIRTTNKFQNFKQNIYSIMALSPESVFCSTILGLLHCSENSAVLLEIIFHVGCSLKIRRTMQTVQESLCGRAATHRQELTVGEDVIY
jgi:hypothetical protein